MSQEGWNKWVEQDCKTFRFTYYGDEYTARLWVGGYRNNDNLAIMLYCYNENEDMWEEWADITVNTVRVFPRVEINSVSITLDTNNFGEGPKLLEELGVGEALPGNPVFEQGFCRFPIYKINLEKLKEYDPMGCAHYDELTLPNLGISR